MQPLHLEMSEEARRRIISFFSRCKDVDPAIILGNSHQDDPNKNAPVVCAYEKNTRDRDSFYDFDGFAVYISDDLIKYALGKRIVLQRRSYSGEPITLFVFEEIAEPKS
jgi:hypothetical protein